MTAQELAGLRYYLLVLEMLRCEAAGEDFMAFLRTVRPPTNVIWGCTFVRRPEESAIIASPALS